MDIIFIKILIYNLIFTLLNRCCYFFYFYKKKISEVINTNHYSPIEGAGEGGRPVQLMQREIITARDLYSLHSYNILVSDRISINRSLPDMRSER